MSNLWSLSVHIIDLKFKIGSGIAPYNNRSLVIAFWLIVYSLLNFNEYEKTRCILYLFFVID